MKISFVLSVISIENLKTVKYHKFFIKHSLFLLFMISNDEKIFQRRKIN